MKYDAPDRLVTETLDLVGLIVREVSARFPRHVDRAELWSAGALGLVEASRRYDPASGVPFARFAAIRIRGAIIDSTRARDWASRSVRRRAREVARALQSMEQADGRSPGEAELAERVGISVEELRSRQAEVVRSTLLQLDMPSEEGEAGLQEVLEYQGADDHPERCFDAKEMQATLLAAVRHLPSPQREVVTRYYLDGEMLQEIAEDFGLTEARVSQIRAEALLSVRAFFATQYEGVQAVPGNASGSKSRAAYLKRMADETSWRTRLTVDLESEAPVIRSGVPGPIDS